MRAARPWLLAAGLAALNVGASGDPLLDEYKRMERDGWIAAEKASTRLSDGSRLVVLLFRQGGDERGRLRVYHVSGRAKLIYIEPSSSMRLTLSSIHRQGRLPDLAGDGSKIISYSATFPGVEQQTLVVLRWNGTKLERLPDFPFAVWEDLDGDGRLEVLARARPLGQFFAIECESFRAMAQTAFQTQVYSWRGSRLVRSSRAYPTYFSQHIQALEDELAAQDPRSTDNYGGYLGNALALYFDYAELGRAQEGWTRFTGLFPVRATDPGQVKACMRQMESTLRARLNIPPHW